MKMLIKSKYKEKLKINNVTYHSTASNILDNYRLLSGYYIPNYKLNCVFFMR